MDIGEIMRKGSLTRKTKETRIQLSLDLDGTGVYEINTGIGFFNHLLETFSRHSLIDLNLDASGDLHVDFHHLVEDCGICLGKALREALGDMKGIRRFGSAVIPLDESLCEAVLDISGRPHLSDNLGGFNGNIGQFPFELLEVFFSGFASAGFTLHVTVRSGRNLHHIAESAFKAFARAVRSAVEPDPRITGVIPSTKEFIQS